MQSETMHYKYHRMMVLSWMDGWMDGTTRTVLVVRPKADIIISLAQSPPSSR